MCPDESGVESLKKLPFSIIQCNNYPPFKEKSFTMVKNRPVMQPPSAISVVIFLFLQSETGTEGKPGYSHTEIQFYYCYFCFFPSTHCCRYKIVSSFRMKSLSVCLFCATLRTLIHLRMLTVLRRCCQHNTLSTALCHLHQRFTTCAQRDDVQHHKCFKSGRRANGGIVALSQQ